MGDHSYGKEHSITLTCPNTECLRHSTGQRLEYITESYHASVAIGVKRTGDSDSNRPYRLSCKCPECFTKYWFHITEDEAKNIAKKFSGVENIKKNL